MEPPDLDTLARRGPEQWDEGRTHTQGWQSRGSQPQGRRSPVGHVGVNLRPGALHVLNLGLQDIGHDDAVNRCSPQK
jgi:hypothetical protein